MAFLDRTGVERLWAHIISKLGEKVDAVEGKGLSTNDYTNEEKEKLAEIVGIDTAHQMFVTDGDGRASWVNKEFYSGTLLTVSHTINGSQHTWVKVSDEIPTGGAYTLGEACWYKEYNTSGKIVTGLAGCEEKYVYTSRYTIVITFEDNVAIDDEYIFPERGTYFEYNDPDSYIMGFAFGANTTEMEITWDGNTETIKTLSPKYLTGTSLTESDNGKVLGVVNGAIGLVYNRIVITYDGTNYTCNVPYTELANCLNSGLPAAYILTGNAAGIGVTTRYTNLEFADNLTLYKVFIYNVKGTLVTTLKYNSDGTIVISQ